MKISAFNTYRLLCSSVAHYHPSSNQLLDIDQLIALCRTWIDSMDELHICLRNNSRRNYQKWYFRVLERQRDFWKAPSSDRFEIFGLPLGVFFFLKIMGYFLFCGQVPIILNSRFSLVAVLRVFIDTVTCGRKYKIQSDYGPCHFLGLPRDHLILNCHIHDNTICFEIVWNCGHSGKLGIFKFLEQLAVIGWKRYYSMSQLHRCNPDQLHEF